jgi:hypothetical protein
MQIMNRSLYHLLLPLLFAALASTVPTTAQLLPAPDDQYWDSRFGYVIDGDVTAVAVKGKEIYLGGTFKYAGNNVAVSTIVHWDGSIWSAIEGLDGPIFAIAVGEDGALYAGGAFGVARRDGGGWSTIGELDGSVFTIAMRGSEIYAGGNFVMSGNDTLNRIARWDGSRWSALAEGIDSQLPMFKGGLVGAISFDGNDLYAAGGFTTAGKDTVHNIARWDGTAWHAMNGGTDNYVRALAVAGGRLYAGGSFTRAGTTEVTGLAAWNGTNGSWSSVGDLDSGSVSTLAVAGNWLYAGGRLSYSGATIAQAIARIDLATGIISPVGTGINGGVNALVSDSAGTVYVGGEFFSAGGENIARWNGTAWSVVDGGVYNGLDGDIRTIALDGDDLYAGGTFSYAGIAKAGSIARWDGTSWHNVGGGITGQVEEIAVDGNDLYVSGRFGQAAEITAVDIVRWNGSNWTPLASTSTGRIYSLALDGDDLYAAGSFTELDSMPINEIARWSKSTKKWSVLDSGIRGGAFPTVHTIAFVGNDLYVAGVFDSAGDGIARNIAWWDRSRWHPVGSGLDGKVTALAVRDGKLYAGGEFTGPYDLGAGHLAVWDGSQWQGIPGSPDGPVSALAFDGEELYVGGSFTMAGGMAVNNIARWNSRTLQWSALGSGVSGGSFTEVEAIAIRGNDIYAGGDFTMAGGRPSFYFAHWNAPVLSVPNDAIAAGSLSLAASPNPFSGATVISFVLPRAGHTTVKIFNVCGEEVARPLSGNLPAGHHTVRWNGEAIADGLYFVRLQQGTTTATSELVIAR